MRFGADGVVALKVSGDEVVGVDELAEGDGLGGKADDLVELADGFAGGDGAYGELVAGGDVGERSETQAVEGLACGYWLEGDHDVVRASEFEGLVSSNYFIISGLLSCVRSSLNSGTTTLYSNYTTKG